MSKYIYSTLGDCYILKYLLLNPVQSHHGLPGDFGHPNINITRNCPESKTYNVINVVN